MTIIMGIDPGSRITGVGVIKQQGKQLHYLHCDNIKLPQEAFSVKLRHLYDALSEVLMHFKPEQVAIESVFMHKNAQSALKLGHARGVAMVAAEIHLSQVFEYTARQIKQAVVGYGGSDKAQVQHMIRQILNLAAIPPSDAADALAVAVCHANTHESLLKLGGDVVATRKYRRGRVR